MENCPRTFPRLNLARFGATGLTVQAVYDVTDERVGLLEGLLGPEQALHQSGSTFPFTSVTIYTTQGSVKRKHGVLGGVSMPLSDDPPAFRVTIDYTHSIPEVEQHYPRELRRESEFLQLIVGFGEPRWSRCGVTWVLTDKRPDELWFPLPALLANAGAGSGRFELRGVRGARYADSDDEEADFLFTLDRPAGADVFVDLQFRWTGPLDERVPASVFKRSRSMLPLLVQV